MNINLTYPNGYSPWLLASFELVFSEPGGKVLLDTIVRFNTAIKATLKTNATVVDMVMIDTVGGGHNITAYKSVNPSSWVNAFPGSYVTRYRTSLPNTTHASLHITHFPIDPSTSALNSFFMNNGPVLSMGSSTFNPSTDVLDLTYGRYSGASNYLSIPGLGLYKLYVPTRDADTFDMTHPDTLITVSYPRPTAFSTNYFAVTFLGITDSTNRSLDINFMDVMIPHTVPNVDLQYPRQPMQLYELYYAGLTPANEGIGFYSYGKSVPTSWNFIDASNFTVSGTQIDNLSIRNNASATISYSYWMTTNNSATLSLYWHPDSSSIHPQTLLTGLKAKFLSGATLSDLKIHSFTYEQMPGFSYSGYFNYACDPAKLLTHQIAWSNYYSKYF